MREIFAYGIRNRGKFACGILNSLLWNPEFNSKNLLKMPLEIGSAIQISLTKNSKFSTWNPESTAWNPESRTVLRKFDHLKG